MTTQYTASNTDQQVIDTFALATIKAVEYKIHAVDNIDSSLSVISITNDGITISETQEAFSVGNNQPAEFVTSIVNANTGRILVAPTAAPVTYTIARTDTVANLFAEHTVSGKLIKHTEGIGIYFTDSANNMTVRSSDRYFGNSSQFVTANVLGPTLIGEQLYVPNNFISYNGSQISTNEDFTSVISSGQNQSSHFIEIPTIEGEVYRVQANALYTFSTIHSRTDTADSGSRIAVGTSVGLSDITFVQITQTEGQYNLDFVATGSNTFISIGHGSLGTVVDFRSLTIRELAPFPTYNQSEGTFYFKWNAIAAGSNVAVMNSNRVFVDSSNNVFINNVNCGAQQLSNKLAYTYDRTTIQHSFDGAAVIPNTDIYFTNVTSCVLAIVPEEISYMSVVVSNTNLIGLSS